MNHERIIESLLANRQVFKGLFEGLQPEEYLWKPAPDKWCILEILCHLYDEEIEDFGTRVKQALENPESPFQPIDPEGWVKERNYIEQEYHQKLMDFLSQRVDSVTWLKSFENAAWGNVVTHPEYGSITAETLLANWLAHDYLHFRQITRTRYQYLQHTSGADLEYAGGW